MSSISFSRWYKIFLNTRLDPENDDERQGKPHKFNSIQFESSYQKRFLKVYLLSNIMTLNFHFTQLIFLSFLFHFLRLTSINSLPYAFSRLLLLSIEFFMLLLATDKNGKNYRLRET